MRVRWLARGRALLAVMAPALWVFIADVARRAVFLSQYKAKYAGFYAGALVMSFVFWSLLMFAASRRRGRLRHLFAGLFIVLYTLSTAAQGAFFLKYHCYDSVQGEIYTRSSLLWPWIGSLPLDWWVLWVHLLLSLGLAVLSVHLARKNVRPAPRTWWFVSPFALAAVVLLRFVQTSYHKQQAAPPDMLYFHAVIANFREQLGFTESSPRTRPQPRRSASVPKIDARPPVPRNVLFILQESQRADVTCIKYDPECKLATRASNAAVPERVPMMRWHSLSTSTNLSCLTLWTGISAAEPKADLQSAPMIFGFAKAAGYNTMYFTSQHVIYQNMRMLMQGEPIDQWEVATTLNMRADWDLGARDSLLSDNVIKRWDTLPEPFMAVVQYSNQHQPYLLDPNHSPFEYNPDEPEDSNANLLAKNKNVVYLSDLAVGRLLEKVVSSELGKRTVVIYTSDHAETFGDHSWYGHTTSFWDAENHVPGWVYAPRDALTAEEHQHLRDKSNAWVTHAEVTPTILDLMGIWDAPAIAQFRDKMIGRPLTRAFVGPSKVMPITNNSWIWESNARSWGVMQDNRKLFGLDGHEQYKCFDLAVDPGENRNLGEAGCPDLAARARELFPSLTDDTRPYHPLK